jgi:maltose O-acetyltransferase
MKLFFRIYFKLERLINRERVRRNNILFKFCGEGVRIDPSCHIIGQHELEVGDYTSIGSFTMIYASFGVKIGKNCWISSSCGISSYNHVINSINRYKDNKDDYKYSKPVKIGDNVWLGMNVCVLPGVEIGENSIIGSGSVVTKSVPANQIWAGNPAHFLKEIDFGSR